MEGVAAAAGTALEGWSGAPGVAAAAAMAAALLAGVLGVADAAAADAGEAGVSTDAAFRVLPVPEEDKLTLYLYISVFLASSLLRAIYNKTAREH